MTRRVWMAIAGAVVGTGIIWAAWARIGSRIQELLGLREPPHPRDEQLITNFARNRATFDRVVTLLREHPDLARGVGPPATTSEFLYLLRTIGVDRRVAISPDAKRIELTASSRGFVTHNSQKGYLYSAEAVRDDIESELDSVSRKGVGSAVRKIDGHWYLFFEGY